MFHCYHFLPLSPFPVSGKIVLKWGEYMLEYINHNLTALIALFISCASFFLSLKNYLKSVVKFKISYDIDSSFSCGFMNYEPYKLIIVNLTIENNSTSAIDITKIKLIDEKNIYISSKIEISDTYNKNGISLINSDESRYEPFDISSENILNNTRIPSYGVLSGFAVFKDIEPLKEPKNYKLVIDTPSKSFSKSITVNPLTGEFHPINPLPNE